MIRTDSMAVYYQPKTNVKNFVWGSQQTGGSSGGPELTNFGRGPNHSSGAWRGYRRFRNILVGVTSWGYTNPQYQVQELLGLVKTKSFQVVLIETLLVKTGALEI